MRLVFAGTPQVAVPSLRRLVTAGHDVLAALTRPDAPSGRGRRLHPSPVREVAEQYGIRVLTPINLRDPAIGDLLAELAPDCCPVVAYGNLVPEALLAQPRHGWVNLHVSLLPAWRGAAPVQRALIAGDSITGASTFRLEAGMDTGPVLGTLEEPIRPDDTATSLLDRLAERGADLLADTLDELAAGTARPRPQPDDGVCFAPKLTSEDARIDWTAPAEVIDRLIRGCTTAPGAWTTFRGERVKIDPVTAGPEQLVAPGPGELVVERRAVHVGTGTGPLTLSAVRAGGRRQMPATDWARGARPAGDRFE